MCRTGDTPCAGQDNRQGWLCTSRYNGTTACCLAVMEAHGAGRDSRGCAVLCAAADALSCVLCAQAEARFARAFEVYELGSLHLLVSAVFASARPFAAPSTLTRGPAQPTCGHGCPSLAHGSRCSETPRPWLRLVSVQARGDDWRIGDTHLRDVTSIYGT